MSLDKEKNELEVNEKQIAKKVKGLVAKKEGEPQEVGEKVDIEDKSTRNGKEVPSKVPVYKKASFWIIIAAVLLAFLLGKGMGNETGSIKESTELSSTTSSTTTTTKTTTQEESTVPKVYSVPAGAKVEKINGKWGLYNNGVLVEGYTGVASNSYGDWYIVNGLVDFNHNGVIKSGSKEYQVDSGKAVLYSNGTTAAPKLSPSDYKAQCKNISYNDLARNPDNYMLDKIHIYGQVLQVSYQDDDEIILRVATKRSDYGNWYDDVVLISYTKPSGTSNILEDDMVNVYGIYAGTTSYESVMGAKITIPSMLAEYVDIS